MKQRGRYETSGLECETGPRGKVLKNLLDIKTQKEINRIETVALKQAEELLFSKYDKNHPFTTTDICHMHKVWLECIYEWAGKYRGVDLIKGIRFAHAVYIPTLMKEFEEKYLKLHTPCIFDSRERVIQALAAVHVELILIHPFREGNGRVARMLATLMALQAGLPLLDFRSIQGRKKQSYFKAVQEGRAGNYRAMERIFERIVETTLSAG